MTDTATIAAGDDVLTLINTFTCADVRQEELSKVVEQLTSEVLAGLDGFLSASVHTSLDHTRVVVYVQWRSVEDFDRAFQVPKVREHLDQIMAVAESADPRLFKVRSVYK